MDFTSNKPIYRQIIDFCFGQVLAGAWSPGGKVPSVRELSVSMSVNSHTVLKAYEYLQAQGVIVPKRGMGFYLTPDAPDHVNFLRRNEFYDTTLKDMFKEMQLLGISIEDVVTHYNEFTDRQVDV